MGQHRYDELLWHLKRLRQAAMDGKLYFVLGAGVSAAYGLADWRSLLLHLMHSSGRLRLPDLNDKDVAFRLGDLLSTVIVDPLLQAEAARNAYGDDARWLDTLRDKLTGNDVDLTTDRGAIGDIAKLVAYQHRRHPHAHIPVLTFNYDNLLERALELELKAPVVHVVASEEDWKKLRPDSPGIYIYHLHGALALKGSEIILDAGSYYKLLLSPANHWSWKCMTRFLFSQSHSGVILLGLSLVDPSIRLWLSEAISGQSNLAALFITNPFPSIADPGDRSLELALANAARDLMTLLDDALETLSLVPYHVSEWSEVNEILKRVTPEVAAA